MSAQDFPIPSLLRDFGDWPAPNLAAGDSDLADQVGLGAARDPNGDLSALLSSLLDALEPALIVLALCGYPTRRLVAAGALTGVAVSLTFETMRVSAWDVQDWSPQIADALHEQPTAVVGLEVSSPRPLPVPVTGVRDGWFLIPVRDASPQLDLRNLLDALGGELPAVLDDLVGDVTRTVGTASLADLSADPDLPSGLLAMFDPDCWLVRSLVNPDVDARGTGDADAEELAGLGEAMRSQIDGEIEAFLRKEVERDRATRMPLRHRFRDDRDDRQVLRRGLRGARRRHRTLVTNGLRRAFRLGRSRRLTYTELLMGCHVEGVVNVLHRLDQRVLAPRLELQGSVYGEPGQQYLIARLPPPYEPLAGYEIVLTLPAPESRLSIRYRRWGAEDGVAGEVDSAQLSLAGGRLPLQLVDGAEASPTISVHSESPYGEPDDLPGDPPPVASLRVAGVQHGDVLIFTDTASGASAEVAVVKNFSRTDLDRLHAAGFQLTAAEPFGDQGGLTSAVTGTIAFILADGPGTAQDEQRRALAAALAGTAPQAGDPPRADPATLDIPSARGVGLFPDDASHVHLRVPSVPAELRTHTDEYRTIAAESLGGVQLPGSLPYHADAQYRSQLTAHHEYWREGLAGVLEQFAQTAGATTIWHTYEIGQASPQYLLAGNLLRLWPGDPIRQTRTDLGGAPTLVQVPDFTSTEIPDGPSELVQVDVFVNRRAEVVLYADPDYRTLGLSYGEVLQVADALASLADGGLPPAAVLGSEDHPTEPGGDQPAPVEEPDQPDPGEELGSVLLRVVDDSGNPLPLAWVTVTGDPDVSIRTGDDGTFLLTDLAPGSDTASNAGYPGHQPGTVDYEVVPGRTQEVELILARIPPGPDLPPLRGQIAEASGFFVREAPGDVGQKLGKLHYRALAVTVLEAREALSDGKMILWFRVRFTPDGFHAVVLTYENELYNQDDLEGQGRLAAALEAHQGTEAWVGADALSIVAMPWDHFLWQLAAFELDYADDDLMTRLSRARQIGENPDVPGNDAADSGHDVEGQINISDRAYHPNRWSFLLEAKQVELPDGEIMDIHHFLLGVEGLIDDGRRSNERTVQASRYGFTLNLRIGESYSALTWSGDLAGAVADMVRHESEAWEEAHPSRTRDETVAFYFRTRAPDFDLLADIDAWGAYDLVPHVPNHLPGSPEPSPGWQPGGPVDTLVELVTEVYGPAGAQSPAHTAQRSRYRAEGIYRLLANYGFTTATGLRSQTLPIDRMWEQVRIFTTDAWFVVKEAKALMGGDIGAGSPWPSTHERVEIESVTDETVPLFLDRLADLASQHGVAVP